VGQKKKKVCISRGAGGLLPPCTKGGKREERGCLKKKSLGRGDDYSFRGILERGGGKKVLAPRKRAYSFSLIGKREEIFASPYEKGEASEVRREINSILQRGKER